MKVLKRIFFTSLLSLLTVANGNVVAKEEKSIEYDPVVVHSINSVQVDRAKNLDNFFKKYNSPLAGQGEQFVQIADKYDIDYRLVPAIAGMESTLCKRIPYESNNCWGWGVYGNNVIRFESFEAGADAVAKGLKENYVDKGLDTPEKIAPVYTPPNSFHWKNGVRFFMSEIDNTKGVDRS